MQSFTIACLSRKTGKAVSQAIGHRGQGKEAEPNASKQTKPKGSRQNWVKALRRSENGGKLDCRSTKTEWKEVVRFTGD